MLKEETEYSPVRNPSETIPGFFVSRVKAFAALLLFISLVIVLIVLAVLLVKQKGKQELKAIPRPKDPVSSMYSQTMIEKGIFF